MDNRREFLKKSLIAGGFATVGANGLLGMDQDQMMEGIRDGEEIRLTPPSSGSYFEPLETVSIASPENGTIIVYDGAFNEYFRAKASAVIRFKAAGVLGIHQVVFENRWGKPVDIATFPVNCMTGIEDDEGEFSDLMEILKYTLMGSSYNRGALKRMNGEHYLQFSSWFQDHMYALLGMRYFARELKSGVDLYTEGQREDGMIHDNYKHPRDPRGPWVRRFDYGNFVKVPENPDSSSLFVRVPVENMAEFTYMEAVYLTWKATGDDRWMMTKLDSMLRAMNYTLTDPYRWSEKFNLTKRGYTIDIWDFQSDYDTKISGDTMRVYLDKSHFGILYADNVRFAQSCNYLAEMLEYAQWEQQAEEAREVAKKIKRRIDDLSWNGQFYRHWVPEEPEVERDFGGTDETKQVTMSNTWILNRGMMDHEQVKSIIQTYQRIRGEMPESSPGEWYCCYPPFEKGWSAKKWNYMNGGVSPIAAGELALACFDHGFEEYGVDILRRVRELAIRTDRILQGCYKGAIEEAPERTFEKIDLREQANADIVGTGEKPKGVMGWTNEGDNDLHEFPTGNQVFKEIPFDIIDPGKNGRRSVLAISGVEGYRKEAVIEVDRKAGSLYFLHCMGGGAIAGSMTWNYADGSSVTKYISSVGGSGLPVSVKNWWMPEVAPSKKDMQYLHTAWIGANNHSPKIGVVIYGMNNPEPGKLIKNLHFEAQKDQSKWMILGLTLSDKEVYFEPNILSTIPQHWAAAECMYGLMEGLAGVRDTGVAFNTARLSPRWDTAGVKGVKVNAKYEPSGGYLSYEYRWKGKRLVIDFTGSGEKTFLELLVPKGKSITHVTVDDHPIDVQGKNVEQSDYVTFTVEGSQAHRIVAVTA